MNLRAKSLMYAAALAATAAPMAWGATSQPEYSPPRQRASRVMKRESERERKRRLRQIAKGHHPVVYRADNVHERVEVAR